MVAVTLVATAGVVRLVAVTVTAFGTGATLGGVYRPPVVIEPADPVAPAGSATDQFTPVVVVPVTLAVNCWKVPMCTDAGDGDTVTTTCA
jgi:hypothetical protein